MVMSIEAYLSLYFKILIGGAWTIFVLTTLVLFGFYCLKWCQIGMKLINRYFERRMRSGHISKKIKKLKVAVVKHLSFEPKKNGKAEAGK
jgi:hypothetical protein